MSATHPKATARIGRHPIHSMLSSFPIACFIGAFITDIVYWRSPDVQWETFSVWLLTAGLVTAVLAAAVGMIDFFANKQVRATKTGWPHALGMSLAVVLSIFNAFVHSRDGYTAVVPTGIVLSGIVVVSLVVTAWWGGEMVYRDGVGAPE
jgi:uncharacterized membrane protein